MVAAERGLPVHMDGARLWNASVATGIALSEIAECAETVMVAFSKGLGAPVGAALAGTHAAIERAWTARKLFGGAMRQSGVLAAAVLHALDHHIDRLVDDHDNAQTLARTIDGAGGATVVVPGYEYRDDRSAGRRAGGDGGRRGEAQRRARGRMDVRRAFAW